MADEAGGGESGASGSGSGSGTEPAPAPPATGTPIPIGDAVVSTICVLYIFFIVFVPQAQLKRFCVIDQFFKLPKVIVDSKPNHFESKRAFNSCVEHAIRDFVVVNSKIMFLFSNRTGQNFYLPFLCC